MEIKFTQGDRITIPDGCAVGIQNGCVVFEPQLVRFKDGDILVVKGNKGKKCPFIYAGDDDEGGHKFYVGIDIFGEVQRSGGGGRWGNAPLQHANQSEVQYLFEQMKRKGLRWNAEEKRVEKIRYRAKKYDTYWYIDSRCSAQYTTEDEMNVDNEHYESGNYFRNEEDAERFLEILRESLRKFHQDDQL